MAVQSSVGDAGLSWVLEWAAGTRWSWPEAHALRPPRAGDDGAQLTSSGDVPTCFTAQAPRSPRTNC